MSRTNWTLAACVVAGVIGMAAPAIAQEEPRPGGGAAPAGQDDRGGRGGDFRQRMTDRMKEMLGASDEEMKVLQPRLEKVMTLQMQARGGGGMWGGRRGGGPGGGGGGGAAGGAGGGPGGGAPAGGPMAAITESEVGKAAAALRTTLDDKAAKPEAIKAKLDDLRKARAKAREELAKAQQNLREVLSMRQEALLVANGMLE